MGENGSILWGFALAAAQVALWPFRFFEARAALARLAVLDDRELADIGLSRCDLRDATALSRDADPTGFLAGRVDAKRASATPLPPPKPPRRARKPRLWARTG